MLADINDLITDLLPGATDFVTPEQQTRAIRLAVTRYNADAPRVLIAEVTSAGGTELPLPADWEAGFSKLLSVELKPYLVPAEHLSSEYWQLSKTAAGDALMLAGGESMGQIARLAYTVRHVLDDTTDTIPPEHQEAVACAAAGLLCEQIATRFANAQDSTIAADRVDQAHPAREWASRARSYRNRYYATLGIQIGRDGLPEPRREAAGVVVDLDLKNSLGGRPLYRRGRR